MKVIELIIQVSKLLDNTIIIFVFISTILNQRILCLIIRYFIMSKESNTLYDNSQAGIVMLVDLKYGLMYPLSVSKELLASENLGLYQLTVLV